MTDATLFENCVKIYRLNDTYYNVAASDVIHQFNDSGDGGSSKHDLFDNHAGIGVDSQRVNRSRGT